MKSVEQYVSMADANIVASDWQRAAAYSKLAEIVNAARLANLTERMVLVQEKAIEDL